MTAYRATPKLHFAGQGDVLRPRRQRILIGILETLSALRNAIGDLVDAGLDPEDLLIAAEADAFSGPLEQYIPARGRADAKPHILIRRNKFGKPVILGAGFERKPLIVTWVASGLSSTQMECLHSGGALLAVSVLTAEEERSYSETMLIHSIDNVQLHDF